MRNLAIIPARSGSKGVKDKNIRLLKGKPLMAYSIDAAVKSGVFDTVMVSTDSELYARIAVESGAEVPFLRSKENSSDTAGSWDTVAEILERYGQNGEIYDTFCLLQPTSPFRNAEDIKKAYEIYEERSALAVVSVCELEHPLAWCGTLPEDFSLDGFLSRAHTQQRQKQEKGYRVNGAIYIVSVPEFYKDRFFYRKGGFAYIMDRERSIDIDTENDFKYAEFLSVRGGGYRLILFRWLPKVSPARRCA